LQIIVEGTLNSSDSKKNTQYFGKSNADDKFDLERTSDSLCRVPDITHQLQFVIPNMQKAVDYYEEETKCNISAHAYIHLQALLN
jgi:hypothetical protein